MSADSKIEWTDATWNVVIGCDKVSPGCDHCYAIRTAHRMQANPNEKIAAAYAGTEHEGEWTGKVNLIEDRLELPLTWTKPKKIFVNAQSDLFHADVPDDFIAKVWAVMAITPRHTYQILTKRPARMRSLLSSAEFESLVWQHVNRLLDGEWLHLRPPHPLAAPSWPLPNVWLGVSVEDQKGADLRVRVLLGVPAAVRFLSCEPLLGPVDLHQAIQPNFAVSGWKDLTLLHWVIAGGESGPGARPMHPDWARSLRDQCTAADVAFHFKQWGEWVTEDQSPQDIVLPATSWSHLGDGEPSVWRVGKKRAGRELDGRTWDEFPREAIA
jgi:protein gp37